MLLLSFILYTWTRNKTTNNKKTNKNEKSLLIIMYVNVPSVPQPKMMEVPLFPLDNEMRVTYS